MVSVADHRSLFAACSSSNIFKNRDVSSYNRLFDSGGVGAQAVPDPEAHVSSWVLRRDAPVFGLEDALRTRPVSFRPTREPSPPPIRPLPQSKPTGSPTDNLLPRFRRRTPSPPPPFRNPDGSVPHDERVRRIIADAEVSGYPMINPPRVPSPIRKDAVAAKSNYSRDQRSSPQSSRPSRYHADLTPTPDSRAFSDTNRLQFPDSAATSPSRVSTAPFDTHRSSKPRNHPVYSYDPTSSPMRHHHASDVAHQARADPRRSESPSPSPAKAALARLARAVAARAPPPDHSPRSPVRTGRAAAPVSTLSPTVYTTHGDTLAPSHFPNDPRWDAKSPRGHPSYPTDPPHTWSSPMNPSGRASERDQRREPSHPRSPGQAARPAYPRSAPSALGNTSGHGYPPASPRGGEWSDMSPTTMARSARNPATSRTATDGHRGTADSTSPRRAAYTSAADQAAVPQRKSKNPYPYEDPAEHPPGRVPTRPSVVDFLPKPDAECDCGATPKFKEPYVPRTLAEALASPGGGPRVMPTGFVPADAPTGLPKYGYNPDKIYDDPVDVRNFRRVGEVEDDEDFQLERARNAALRDAILQTQLRRSARGALPHDPGADASSMQPYVSDTIAASALKGRRVESVLSLSDVSDNETADAATTTIVAGYDPPAGAHLSTMDPSATRNGDTYGHAPPPSSRGLGTYEDAYGGDGDVDGFDLNTDDSDGDTRRPSHLGSRPGRTATTSGRTSASPPARSRTGPSSRQSGTRGTRTSLATAGPAPQRRSTSMSVPTTVSLPLGSSARGATVADTFEPSRSPARLAVPRVPRPVGPANSPFELGSSPPATWPAGVPYCGFPVRRRSPKRAAPAANSGDDGVYEFTPDYVPLTLRIFNDTRADVCPSSDVAASSLARPCRLGNRLDDLLGSAAAKVKFAADAPDAHWEPPVANKAKGRVHRPRCTHGGPHLLGCATCDEDYTGELMGKYEDDRKKLVAAEAARRARLIEWSDAVRSNARARRAAVHQAVAANDALKASRDAISYIRWRADPPDFANSHRASASSTFVYPVAPDAGKGMIQQVLDARAAAHERSPDRQRDKAAMRARAAESPRGGRMNPPLRDRGDGGYGYRASPYDSANRLGITDGPTAMDDYNALRY